MNMKILLIEENQDAINELIVCLNTAFPDAIVAMVTERKDAIELISHEFFNLAILAPLAELNGINLIDHIRKSSNVPLMVVLREQNELEICRYLEAGADEYLVLPLDQQVCSAKVRALIRFGEKVS